MSRKSPLEDPATAAHAWRRFRRLLWITFAAATGAAGAAVVYLASLGQPVSIHYYIATAIGIVCTVMMAGVLMGLAFLSSGTGHDDSVED